ncbi:hypothetical protein MPEAHAMD_6844 [Methylobacterium frigidaeris]|uniref:Hedgehog/Intein (Hint) domain-containing protein n=1 Tax=Methylobacterium frigidaeris TaxID=2038277 RepID=A0AA37HIU0_9HYPH|nr:hypothetical protein MPEAHAMD_6844 [Methylobacterium frigidaeris]
MEALSIGDMVVTASGEQRPIKWIGTRAYAGRFLRNNPDLLPIRLQAGCLADGIPARDLHVSPRHAMFLDGCLIPAAHLVNGTTITKVEHLDSLTYWHIELDSHDVLVAEGAPSESFVDDNSRGIFHNAHTFSELYRQEQRKDAVYCAPRVEDGFTLEAVRRRLNQRAGLPLPPAHAFGQLRGYLDHCSIDEQGRLTVRGWAQDLAHPDGPVCLDIVVDGVVAALTFAETYRPDLERAGIGDGCHAFSLILPEPFALGISHQVEVRRSADRAPLTTSRPIGASGLAA